MGKKGRLWVLDTDTKGTGAQMVPLEAVQTGLPAPPVRSPASTKVVPNPRPPKAPEPKKPSIFKVVDAVSRQVLADRSNVLETLDALENVRSVVDVSIYAWEHAAENWRPLTLGERKTLFKLRDR